LFIFFLVVVVTAIIITIIMVNLSSKIIKSNIKNNETLGTFIYHSYYIKVYYIISLFSHKMITKKMAKIIEIKITVLLYLKEKEEEKK
jgi:uncharacterized membrane protein